MAGPRAKTRRKGLYDNIHIPKTMPKCNLNLITAIIFQNVPELIVGLVSLHPIDASIKFRKSDSILVFKEYLGSKVIEFR